MSHLTERVRMRAYSYSLGTLFHICGKIMMATYDSNSMLSWFVLMHDDLMTFYGDIPFDYDIMWYVEYPRRYT